MKLKWFRATGCLCLTLLAALCSDVSAKLAWAAIGLWEGSQYLTSLSCSTMLLATHKAKGSVWSAAYLEACGDSDFCSTAPASAGSLVHRALSMRKRSCLTESHLSSPYKSTPKREHRIFKCSIIIPSPKEAIISGTVEEAWPTTGAVEAVLYSSQWIISVFIHQGLIWCCYKEQLVPAIRSCAFALCKN